MSLGMSLPFRLRFNSTLSGRRSAYTMCLRCSFARQSVRTFNRRYFSALLRRQTSCGLTVSSTWTRSVTTWHLFSLQKTDSIVIIFPLSQLFIVAYNTSFSTKKRWNVFLHSSTYEWSRVPLKSGLSGSVNLCTIYCFPFCSAKVHCAYPPKW